MNDHDAIEELNRIFDDYCDNGLRELAALSRIGRVLGLNKIAHDLEEAAK